MVGSLSTRGRRDGASSHRLSSLPGRLTIVGGFVLLGWFALAIAGATHAAASPGSPDPHQVPTISSMLRGSRTAAAHAVSPSDPAGRVIGVLRQPARRPVLHSALARITPAGHTWTYGSAPVTLPAGVPRSPHPRSVAHPMRAGPVALPVASVNGLLNDLPVDPVLKPVEAAVAPVAGLLAPIDQVVTQLGTAVSSASSTVDSLLAPVDRAVADSVSSLTTGLAATAGLLPAVGPIAPPVASPGPPAPIDGSPVGQGESGVLPAPPDGSASVLSPASGSVAEFVKSTSASIQPASSPAPVSAAARRLDRTRVPGPWPTIPPSAPELLAIASAPGAAVISTSGTGGTALPGFNTGDSWAAQQLHRIGVVDSGGSRAVRNSATKPPVSPD